jgi:hypothetical protein
MGRLQEIGLGGSVNVYGSEQKGYAMKAISDDRYLFGLTAVFHWAVQMLAFIRTICVILEATFRMLKPYVLEILNLIFANESTSITLGFFPTESQRSYKLLCSPMDLILARD